MQLNRPNLLFTLIAIALLLAAGFSVHYALVPWLFALPWLLYTPVRLVWLHSGKHFSWRNWGIQFAMWLLAWATLFFGQQHIEQRIRQDAMQIVAQIEQYHAQHHRYPDALGEVYPRNTLYHERRVRYQVPAPQQPPVLEYESIIPLDWHRYDFALRQWQYMSD